MSVDVIIRSSVLNLSRAQTQHLLSRMRANVKEPNAEFDDSGDLIIPEDVDMRFLKEIILWNSERANDDENI